MKIREIKKIKLAKDDILLIEMKRGYTEKDRNDIFSMFNRILPNNPIVLNDGLKFTALVGAKVKEVDVMVKKES